MLRKFAALVCCAWVFGAGRAWAGDAEIPSDWFSRAPSSERVAAVQAIVAQSGWSSVSSSLYAGAVRAYELRQEDAALAWYHMARWCDLFGRSQAEMGMQWLETMGKASAGRLDLGEAGNRALPAETMSKLISPGTGLWLLGDARFSDSFFELATPYDCMPRVLEILERLRKSDPRRFASYAQLALAIALVYDQPPPAYWPHWQVSAEALPRRLPEPLDVFVFLTDADRRGATLHKLGTLSAAELKYVVDIAAGPDELRWAQASVKYPLKDLAKSYEAVRYRNDRIEENRYVWPGSRYTLPEILGEGGICVDQAYFATQAGKARGVPTLLFSGAGKDGRHAWFGYLGASQKWVLDAGRYEEQRYVTGETIDPQTWGALSDHELSFLSEGFLRMQPYRQSRQHQVFAELYLRNGNKTAALEAARKAVNFERRNFDAWELLVEASADAPAATRETILRDAARAMQRYPDLNARFVHALAASLRARGEKSAAEFEERALVRRGQIGGRSDFGVDRAVTVMAETSGAELVAVHRKLLQQYGVDAPTDFYDRVTMPLVRRLRRDNRPADAATTLRHARGILKPEPGSQLDREMAELAESKS